MHGMSHKEALHITLTSLHPKVKYYRGIGGCLVPIGLGGLSSSVAQLISKSTMINLEINCAAGLRE